MKLPAVAGMYLMRLRLNRLILLDVTASVPKLPRKHARGLGTSIGIGNVSVFSCRGDACIIGGNVGKTVQKFVRDWITKG